jgi:hypothetical protein
MTSCRYDVLVLERRVVTGPERVGFLPPPGGPPPALVSAARRPREGGSTLVLKAGSQNVIVVLDSEGGEASLMWAFIQKYLTDPKAMRM